MTDILFCVVPRAANAISNCIKEDVLQSPLSLVVRRDAMLVVSLCISALTLNPSSKTVSTSTTGPAQLIAVFVCEDRCYSRIIRRKWPPYFPRRRQATGLVGEYNLGLHLS